MTSRRRRRLLLYTSNRLTGCLVGPVPRLNLPLGALELRNDQGSQSVELGASIFFLSSVTRMLQRSYVPKDPTSSGRMSYLSSPRQPPSRLLMLLLLLLLFLPAAPQSLPLKTSTSTDTSNGFRFRFPRPEMDTNVSPSAPRICWRR
jgi:hypothetical protein